MSKFKVNREASNKLCWPSFVCLIVLLNSLVAFTQVVVVARAAAAADNMNGQSELIEDLNRGLGVTVKKSLPEKREAQSSGDLDSMPMSNIDNSELETIDGLKVVDEASSVTAPEVPIEELISKDKSLFQEDSLSTQNLGHMDCHLRNIDYCFAGLLATSTHILPENDIEFEVRCDEIKATTSCVAVFNQRCQTMKVFAAFGPITGIDETNEVVPQELRDTPMIPAAEQLILNKDGTTGNNDVEIKYSDLINICQPSAKRTKANRILRQRLFQIGRCINQRLPQLAPCIEDLKTALQLFFEPTRSLPLKPTCCAINRFRACSMDALDNVCGLSSFKELEKSLSSLSSNNVFTALDRVCKQSTKLYDFKSCSDVLPPSGMKISQRTGRKASKLVRALDLIQFAPGVSQSANSS